MSTIVIMNTQFLYDTHIHTIEVSPCGKIHAAETVDAYAAQGYAGLVITDHFHNQFLEIADTEHNWDLVIDRYMAGYRAAKKRGDEIGFNVIDEAWLRAHPYVICQSARDFFKRYRDEVLVMHAHPFRDGNMTVFEDSVHGIELINTNPRHNNWPERALELCKRHPEYYRQAGSDMHRTEDRCRAGIITNAPIRDSYEYADLIRSGNFELYAPDFPEYTEEDKKMRGFSIR